MASAAPETVANRYAGRRVERVEDTRLLTGRGTYVDDITRPGMLHACFVRSPYAHARFSSIDAAAALALPGVHAVLTAADLNPEVKEAWHAVAGKDVADTPRPPLAEGEVKFVGDPVALVIAANRYVAEDAATLSTSTTSRCPPWPTSARHSLPRCRSTRPSRTTMPAVWPACRPTKKSSDPPRIW